ncbi:hypothetical protein LCGC14_1684640 [marine sediment metagenome]|uniref:Methyltransferase domain-containing protein n=1 Tax=marine sediment metagenome TaxID=412755 RepID=A0A0F9KMP5_9ZZZZ
MKTLTIDVDEVKNVDGRHRFYKWLAMQFNGGLIVEMGTGPGRSAKCWAFNKTNLVLTYDIKDHLSDYTKRGFNKLCNLLRIVKDCNEVGPEWFSKVDIIYLDINHNGTDEERFLQRIAPYFKGILVMDDVDCKKRWCKLYDLFNGLERELHLLPSSICS